MRFYFTVNLQCLAKLSVATSFWESEKVKTKVKEYFYKHDVLREEDEWTKITKSATDLFERTCFPLPSDMYAELVCIIRDIGLKIHDWFDSIKYMVLSDGVNRKTLYDLYMKKIYWTHYGMIDGPRILKEAWMNIPDDTTGVIFTMGCLCCLEDDIYKLWTKLPESLRNKIWKSKNDLYNTYGCYMLLYWLESQVGGYSPMKKFNQNILEAEGECADYVGDRQSPEANMLIFSAFKGHGRAVKYFWENMSPSEQDDNIEDALICALKNLKSVSRNGARHFYRKEQYIETCIFLMKQMNESDMQNAIKLVDTESELDLENIIHLFMNIWPWWENFSNFLNLIQPFLTDKNYDDMFTVMVDYYSKDLKNRIYQRMILLILHSKPKEAEITLKQKHFDCLLDAWDLTSLKMIFKDPSVSGPKAKAKLMKFVFKKMLNSLNNNQEEKIEEFIKEVLTVEEENEIYMWILKCDVKNLTNIYSDEKYKEIKSILCPQTICKHFITKNEFDVADKFLKWRFDSSKNQIRNLKYKIRNSDFTREYIFDIWIRSKDVSEAKNKSNKLLNWFLTQKEIDRFKKKHIIKNYKTDKDDLNRFFDQFVEKDRYEMVEPLMVWCGIEEKYVAEYRKFLIKACVLHYLENNKIDVAEKLFVWAVTGEKSRNKYVQDLISSDRDFFGSLKRFIANCDEENENLLEVFTGFVNFWIKPTGFGEKIRRKLISWKDRIKRWNGREINYKKIRKDPWLSGKYTDDRRDRKKELDRPEIYSSDKKIDLFISVLDWLKNDDTSVKSLNVCRLFWNKIAQNGENFEEKIDDKNKEEEGSACDSDNSDDEDGSDSEEEGEENAEEEENPKDEENTDDEGDTDDERNTEDEENTDDEQNTEGEENTDDEENTEDENDLYNLYPGLFD